MSTPAIPPQQQREHPEPTERSRPMPRALLLMAALMPILGAAYIAADAPQAPAAWGDQRVQAELGGSPAGTGPAGAAAAAPDGAAIYAARCAACHQPAGTGVPGAFPPLAGSEWLAGPERRLVALVLHGVTGPLTVKGTAYNGAMPPFGAQLNDAELAALLSHLRRQWAAGVPAVAASTVAEVRQATKDRSSPFGGEAELGAFK